MRAGSTNVNKKLRIKNGSKNRPLILDIAQMTQYRMQYVQNRDDESKEKMIKYTILSGVGILSLLTIGILGMMENRKSDNRVLCAYYDL